MKRLLDMKSEYLPRTGVKIKTEHTYQSIYKGDKKFPNLFIFTATIFKERCVFIYYTINSAELHQIKYLSCILQLFN